VTGDSLGKSVMTDGGLSRGGGHPGFAGTADRRLRSIASTKSYSIPFRQTIISCNRSLSYRQVSNRPLTLQHCTTRLHTLSRSGSRPGSPSTKHVSGIAPVRSVNRTLSVDGKVNISALHNGQACGSEQGYVEDWYSLGWSYRTGFTR
jgi:hypothetical protein